MAADRVHRIAERLARGLVQVDLRTALTVERAVRVTAHGLAVDQEQPDSAVGQLRADDQSVSGVAGEHRVLLCRSAPTNHLVAQRLSRHLR